MYCAALTERMVKSAALLLRGFCPRVCLLTDAVSLLPRKTVALGGKLTGCVKSLRGTISLHTSCLCCVILKVLCALSVCIFMSHFV